MIPKIARKRPNSGALLSCAAFLASVLTGGAESGPATPGGGARLSAGHSATATPAAHGPAGEAAKPAPDSLPPKPAAKDKTKNATEITANEANFNSKAHVGVFSGEVVVLSPDFNVKCEKLTAYLRHAEPKPAAAVGPTPAVGKSPATPAPNPKPTSSPKPSATPAPAPAGAAGRKGAAPEGAPAEPEKASGLEKAVAEGGVVITQDKKNADGTIEHDTGHAQRAYYDATSGNVTLTGRPDVQQGGNLCVALDDSTIMILNRNGNMRVHGPHKSVLIDNSSPDTDSKK